MVRDDKRPAGRSPAADDRLATIRALLAKAEATPFAAEAEAFTAKASELIARYAIDEALLWAEHPDAGAGPSEVRIALLAPYLAQKAVLVDRVSRACGCRAIRLMDHGVAARETVVVVGFGSDLAVVEPLVTSLLVQLTSSMLTSAPAGLSPSGSAGWRRSFIVGFAETVGGRLEADRRRAAGDSAHPGGGGHGSDADSGPLTGGRQARAVSTALVLAERSVEVDAEFRRRFPRIRSSAASAGRSTGGRDAGRRAGERADLGHGHLARRRELPGAGR